MENIINYAKKQLNTFAVSPLNEVDSIIFAWLSYIHFDACHTYKDGCTIRDLFMAEDFEKMINNVNDPAETIELLAALSASPRFRGIKLSHFADVLDKNKNIQFSAITFSINKKLHYIAYRGTDMTIIGWKEDFELALDSSIPAQRKALEYLKDSAENLSGQLILGGHSKGGNLAMYSAAHCGQEISDRITTVYSFDGPGFTAHDLLNPGFKLMENRLVKYVPQSSIIGMLFESECQYTIIESKGKSVMQHLPFSWVVVDDHFVRRAKLTPDAVAINKRLSSWLLVIDQEERKKFIDTFFEVFESTGVDYFSELGDNLPQNLQDIAKNIGSQEMSTISFMLHTMSHLVLGGNKIKADFPRLEQNICDMIKEEQIKLGYCSETIRLYYPLSSINSLLGTSLDVSGAITVLEDFVSEVKPRLGDVSITVSKNNRFCIKMPPQAGEYVNDNTPSEGFLYDFIEEVSKHDTTMNRIFRVFRKYSREVSVRKSRLDDFDYLVYFKNGIPDSYIYCLKDEGCHITYHRFTFEDLKEMGIKL